MKISKLFFCLSFLLLGNSFPLHAAGSKSKLLVGLAAAAGSAIATGIAAIVNSIKDGKIELLQQKNVNLDDQINFLMVQDALKSEFACGIAFGAGTVALLWLLSIYDAPYNEKTGIGNMRTGRAVLEGIK